MPPGDSGARAPARGRAYRRTQGPALTLLADDRFALVHARSLTALENRPIATMELRIATAALVDGAVLVIRNGRHVSRVPVLEIRSY